MKIGMIDVDNIGKQANFHSLPLMKLSAWHKRQGDSVEWWFPCAKYDVVYQSKVFTFTPDLQYNVQAEKIMKGGTGYDLENKLPEEVERITPDYSLYQRFAGTAYGFLTRGCPRNCTFCIVTKKEGRTSQRVAELCEFWRDQAEIKLLDPNLLACAEREKLLYSLAESGAKVDFTQGLDIRLTDADVSKMLMKIRIKNLHFAWDNPKEDLTGHFRRFKQWTGLDYRKMGVYVLTNYKSTLMEDLERVYTLRDLGYSPYVMIYDKEHAPHEIKRLQRWCNNRIVFAQCSRFDDYNARL